MALRSLSRLLAAGALVGLVHCSLLTDLGGLSSGSSSSGADGAAGADGAGGTDGATSEASSDASSSGAESGPASPCAPGTTHLFCTTFDTAAIGAIFDSYGTGNGGTLAIESSAAFSAPSALRIGHPGGDPGSTPYAAKTLNVTNLAGVKCRMRYRRETMGGGILVLFIVEVKTNGSARFFGEVKDGASTGKIYLETTRTDGTVASDFPDIPTVASASNAWADLEWTLDFDASTSTLRRDATNIDTRTFMAPFDGRQAKTMTLTVGLGLFQAPASPWLVRVDDLVCDAL